MAKGAAVYTEMADARQSDGINVIFDQNSPSLSRSRSQSRGSCGSSRSSGSGYYRGRSSQRMRHRSSSSSTSSSSTSSSRSRSRSHPRCHRRSSRCCCGSHRRYGRGRQRCSPSTRDRTQSRLSSRSPLPNRYSSRRHYRSRSRSSSRWYRNRRPANRFRSRSSRSPSKTHRSRSKSRSSGSSVSLSVTEKKELLEAAKTSAMKTLGVETLELPESVKPILTEQLAPVKPESSPEPEIRVRQAPEKTASQQSEEEEPDEGSSPTMSPKRRVISFSIHNSVAKPTVAPLTCAKVTPRVDSYESRKPYGHWIPVKSGQTSTARKRTLNRSR